MIHEAYPFNGKTIVDLDKEIREKTPVYKDGLSNTMHQLLDGLLEKNPSKRITLKQALKLLNNNCD